MILVTNIHQRVVDFQNIVIKLGRYLIFYAKKQTKIKVPLFNPQDSVKFAFDILFSLISCFYLIFKSILIVF